MLTVSNNKLTNCIPCTYSPRFLRWRCCSQCSNRLSKLQNHGLSTENQVKHVQVQFSSHKVFIKEKNKIIFPVYIVFPSTGKGLQGKKILKVIGLFKGKEYTKFLSTFQPFTPKYKDLRLTCWVLAEGCRGLMASCFPLVCRTASELGLQATEYIGTTKTKTNRANYSSTTTIHVSICKIKEVFFLLWLVIRVLNCKSWGQTLYYDKFINCINHFEYLW